MAGFWGKRKRDDEQQQQLDAQDADLAARARSALVAADERIRVTSDELGFADQRINVFLEDGWQGATAEGRRMSQGAAQMVVRIAGGAAACLVAHVRGPDATIDALVDDLPTARATLRAGAAGTLRVPVAAQDHAANRVIRFEAQAGTLFERVVVEPAQRCAAATPG